MCVMCVCVCVDLISPHGDVNCHLTGSPLLCVTYCLTSHLAALFNDIMGFNLSEKFVLCPQAVTGNIEVAQQYLSHSRHLCVHLIKLNH